MELRDGELMLRPWTLDDVPAIIRACNDPEIQRWIPVIPRPYTDDDARSFVTAEDLGHQFAIVEEGELIGSIGMRGTRSPPATSATGARRRPAGAA